MVVTRATWKMGVTFQIGNPNCSKVTFYLVFDNKNYERDLDMFSFTFVDVVKVEKQPPPCSSKTLLLTTREARQKRRHEAGRSERKVCHN